MEADWVEATRITIPGAHTNAPPSQATAFVFDASQEVLWTGNEFGTITAFQGPDVQRYISYRGHVNTVARGAPGNAAVRQILLCDKGVISVSPRSVHLSSRRGLAQWHAAQDGMSDLRCMSFANREASEVIVAGCQTELYRIDVEKGTVTTALAPQGHASFILMRFAGQHICVATQEGSICLLDPKTLAVVHSWKAYAGAVHDMDVRGDYLLTCGWAQMQYQGLGLERLVRVYDLKAQRPLPPVPFQSGAAFVRMHPKLSSTCIVVSQTGLIHSIDIQNPDMPVMRYANTFDVQYSRLELMPSGKGFALADNNGHVYVWGQPHKLQFAEYSKLPEFADPVTGSKHIDWSIDTPLNTIGMPFYREALLSGWSNGLLHQVGLQLSRVEIHEPSFRIFDYGKVGPNPKSKRRYEAQGLTGQKSSESMTAPKFLSEKPREEGGGQEAERRMSQDLLKALNGLKLDGNAQADPRFLYRNVEIKYSRFGVEDFDFRYYNKTAYAGLETHIVNSYGNALLQLLRFTPVARNLALHHTARDCRAESCMFCELGFLIDMLEKAKSPNCQATNFFKTMGKQPDALQQNVLEDKVSGMPLPAKVQSLSRFLLQKLEMNFGSVASSLEHFHLAFGTIGLDHTQCTHCSYESRMDKVWYTHDLVYRLQHAKQRTARQYFSQVLKASIERQSQHRGWCLRCNGYKAMVSHRAIHCLPAVLMLNAAISNADSKQIWGTPDFLPREIGVIVNNGRFFCYEGQDLQLHLQRGHFNITVYELVGVVNDVRTSETEKSHLVATIDVGLMTTDSSKKGDWHLFNDFSVHKLSSGDALHFDPQWKLPCIITYQVKSMSHVIDDTWKRAIDTSILYRSPIQPATSDAYRFRILSEEETLPGYDLHVAIDAEFVRLLREEIDVGPDGSRTMTRPARSGLARVSVLRGDGVDQGLPFIDDYIAIDEPIDDYLTQYSGLREGDLTVGRSRFTLVNLKEVYKKLWVLLNLGATFIGHGLSSDLRIINIHVPESQIIDTQDLFSLGSRSRRKLSLKFLAWAVLQEDIQQHAEQGHDSIEDARTALKLWRKYVEFDSAGVLETIKDELLHSGRALDFRPPADSKRLETPTPSAPGTPQNTIVSPRGIVRTELH